MRKRTYRIISILLSITIMITSVYSDVIRAYGADSIIHTQANSFDNNFTNFLSGGDLGQNQTGTIQSVENADDEVQMFNLGATSTLSSDKLPVGKDITDLSSIIETEDGEITNRVALDLAHPENWPKLRVRSGYWNDNYDLVSYTSGTFEYAWGYMIGGGKEMGEGVGNLVTAMGYDEEAWKWKALEYPEGDKPWFDPTPMFFDLANWTTDTSVPVPMTVGEYRGSDESYYAPSFMLQLYVRHRADDGKVTNMNFSGERLYVELYNSNNENGALTTAEPTAIKTTLFDASKNKVISGDTVSFELGDRYTPVSARINMWSEADGFSAPVNNYDVHFETIYVWCLFDQNTEEAPSLENICPAGVSKERWLTLIEEYKNQYPDYYAAGNYFILLEELQEYGLDMWSSDKNKLPTYTEAFLSGSGNNEASTDMSAYASHTYICFVHASKVSDKYNEETDSYETEEIFYSDFSDAVTVEVKQGNIQFIPSESLIERTDVGYTSDDVAYLECTATYGKMPITYQWYKSTTKDYVGEAIEGATTKEYEAMPPRTKEAGTSLYYYCVYSFQNQDGVTETHRTNIAEVYRSNVSSIDMGIYPGEIYLGKVPTDTNDFQARYLRKLGNNISAGGGDDKYVTYAYQVLGGESVLSAWISADDTMEHADRISYQWYKSDTEDYKNGGVLVGDAVEVSGLSKLPLTYVNTYGRTRSEMNSINQAANIHVECPTNQLEPFYMTAVVTVYHTDENNVTETVEYIDQCKVFTFEKNEDLYRVDNAGKLITYIGHESTMTIPAEVGGVKVTSLDRMACPVNTVTDASVPHVCGARKIIFPEGLTEVSERAFFRLISLEEIVFSSTIETIGNYAFGGVGTVAEVLFPENLKKVGVGAFHSSRIQKAIFTNDDLWPTIGANAFKNSDIRYVKFPANATGELPLDEAFSYCVNLSGVDNYNNITNLDREQDFDLTKAWEYLIPGGTGNGDGSFVYELNEDGASWTVVSVTDSKATDIVIPASFRGMPVTGIGRGEKVYIKLNYVLNEQIVKNPALLRSIIIPNTITHINDLAFAECENLESFNFHNGIKWIGKGAFKNCKRLESDVVTANGARIGESAFANCYSITTAIIPGAKLASWSFDTCCSLENVSSNTSAWIDGIYGNYDKYSNFWYTKARDKYVTYNVVDGKLEKINSDVEYLRVDNYAFKVEKIAGQTVCTYKMYLGVKDTVIEFPGTLTTKNGTLYGIEQTYGNSLFETMLSDSYEVIIGEGIRTLGGYYSFGKPARITKITLPSTLVDLGGMLRGSLIEELHIPENVTFIGSKDRYSYYDGVPLCSNLRKVTFDENSELISFENYAFLGCNNLSEFEFEKLKHLEKIEYDAFGDTQIEVIDLSASTKLKTIGQYAFSQNDAVRVIRLPEGLVEIGENAFCGNRYNYYQVTYEDPMPTLHPLEELVLPSTLKRIGCGAFAYQFMDNANNAPYVLELPDGLEILGDGAFCGEYVTSTVAGETFLSNIALKDGKLPENLKEFACPEDDRSAYCSVESAFAYTPIKELIFPAGIETIGVYALDNMKCLETITFETKTEEIAPGITESYSELRKLQLGNVFDAVKQINGLDSLTKLEEIDMAFWGDNVWKYPGEEYVLPEGVKKIRLGGNNFKSIVLPEGAEEIDLFNFNCNEGETNKITVLGKSNTTPVLGSTWLTNSTTPLYCYSKSVYHTWAVENNYPYVLLDSGEGDLVMNLEMNGYKLSYKDYLNYIQWLDEAGNVVGTQDVLKNPTYGKEYTLRVQLKDNLSWEYMLPYYEVKVTATQEGATIIIPIMPLEHITLKGTFEDAGEPGFKATLQHGYSSDYTEQEISVNADGTFSMEVPLADIVIVVEVAEESPKKNNVIKNFMFINRIDNNLLDLGSIELEYKGVSHDIPVSTDLSQCSKLYIERENGEKVQCYYYEGILNIYKDSITPLVIGEQVTLHSENIQGVNEVVIPYAFSIPPLYMEQFIAPQTKPATKIVYKNNGYILLFDAAGERVITNSGYGYAYSGRYINVPSGNYTAILTEKSFNPESLDEFKEMGVHSENYLELTVTVADGESFEITERAPKWQSTSVLSKFSFSCDANMPDSNGNIPVYILYCIKRDIANSTEATTIQGIIRTDTDTTPFEMVNGSYASIAAPDKLTNIKMTPGGGTTRSRLSFSAEATEGTICFYARPTGQKLSLDINGKYIGSVELPAMEFNVSEPDTFTNKDNGNITLFSNYNGKHYATVYVDGVEGNKVPLMNTKGNTLSYTFKTYTDGSSLHDLCVIVTNEQDEILWMSDSFTFTHTNLNLPEPQCLDIRITNENSVWQDENDTSPVWGVSRVEHASYNMISGEYKPMKFMLPYWFYNADGTMAKSITFDYALTIQNTHLIKDDRITLDVYFNEKNPTIRRVKLNRNLETGTYDGTISIPGNTITIDDLPFGFDLNYSIDAVAETPSHQAMQDSVDNAIKLLNALNVEIEDPIEIPHYDLDQAYYVVYHQDNNLTDEQKAFFMEYLAGVNEISNLMSELDQVGLDLMNTLTPDAMGDSYGFLNELMAGNVYVEPLYPDITENDLLDQGYQKFQSADGMIFVLSDAQSYSAVFMSNNGIEDSIQIISDNPATISMFFWGIDAATVISRFASIGFTLSGGILEAYQEFWKELDKLEKAIVAQQLKHTELTNTKEAYEDVIKTISKQNGNEKIYIEGASETMAKLHAEILDTKKALNVAEEELRKHREILNNKDWKSLKGLAAKMVLDQSRLGIYVGKVLSNAKAVPLLDIASAITGVYFGFNSFMGNLANYHIAEEEYKSRKNNAQKLYDSKIDGECDSYDEKNACKKLYDEYTDALEDYSDFKMWFFTVKSGQNILDVCSAIGGALPVAGKVMNVVSVVLATVDVVGDITYAVTEYNLSKSYWDAEYNMRVSCTPNKCKKPGEEGGGNDDELNGGYSWPGTGPNGEPGYWTPSKPKLDPSGYVYEAVASNRIEGATAQVFYKDAGGEEQLWTEAADYDEINPQVTDVFGEYGWMTPPGYWRVKITKDGYLPANSDNDPAANAEGWLPVPPPQLNVNIGLVSTSAPAVQRVQASKEYVQIVFEQYMDIAALKANPALVQVMQDNKVISTEFEFIDAEESPTEPGVYYGRVLNLKRSDLGIFSGNNITVNVDAAFTNYASTKMNAGYQSAPLSVGVIASAIDHSYPNRLVVDVGEESTVVLQVTDINGVPVPNEEISVKQLYGDTISVMEQNLISDEYGRISLKLKGITSGEEQLVFETVNGVKKIMEIYTSPLTGGKPKKPMTNIADYQNVPCNSVLEITSKEADVELYYTIDNTCPCNFDGDRILYTGPIELKESKFFRIAAYRNGEYSERINIHVNVIHETTLVPEKPSTCVEKGHIAYYTCPCGKWYEDAAATKEILDHSTVELPLADHVWGALILENMQHFRKCTVTGCDETTVPVPCEGDECTLCVHQETEEVHECHTHLTHHPYERPTETASGMEEYYSCSCGRVFRDAAVSQEVFDLKQLRIKSLAEQRAMAEALNQRPQTDTPAIEEEDDDDQAVMEDTEKQDNDNTSEEKENDQTSDSETGESNNKDIIEAIPENSTEPDLPEEVDVSVDNGVKAQGLIIPLAGIGVLAVFGFVFWTIIIKRKKGEKSN